MCVYGVNVRNYRAKSHRRSHGVVLRGRVMGTDGPVVNHIPDTGNQCRAIIVTIPPFYARGQRGQIRNWRTAVRPREVLRSENDDDDIFFFNPSGPRIPTVDGFFITIAPVYAPPEYEYGIPRPFSSLTLSAMVNVFFTSSAISVRQKKPSRHATLRRDDLASVSTS